jgi:hypothetical protein
MLKQSNRSHDVKTQNTENFTERSSSGPVLNKGVYTTLNSVVIPGTVK